MKKLILMLGLIIVAGTIYGQTLKKGNIVTLHVFTLTLNPGVTMDQFLDFGKNKYGPAVEKNFVGSRAYLVKGIKGECLNCNGMMRVWNTKADMEKYYNQDGGATELAITANANVKSINDELGKLAKMTDSKYTTWEIQ